MNNTNRERVLRHERGASHGGAASLPPVAGQEVVQPPEVNAISRNGLELKRSTLNKARDNLKDGILTKSFSCVVEPMKKRRGQSPLMLI